MYVNKHKCLHGTCIRWFFERCRKYLKACRQKFSVSPRNDSVSGATRLSALVKTLGFFELAAGHRYDKRMRYMFGICVF